MDHHSDNQDSYQNFLTIRQEWAQDASSKYCYHFGDFLREKKDFKRPFSASLNQLARLCIKGKKWHAGLITQIVFRTSSISITLYEPQRTILKIPLKELSQLHFELQPRNGTQFIIENEVLVKRDLTTTEGRNHYASPKKRKEVLVS